MANQRTDAKGSGIVKVTLMKSPTGFNRNQDDGRASLGLRRIRHTVELKDTPATRGMIHKVRHLVTVGVDTMDLSRISSRPKGAKHAKKRIGRGQGPATARPAGRGHKGAKSRSGFKFKRGFEGGQMPLHRRVPKRGFHNPFRVEYEVVNLDTLADEVRRRHGRDAGAAARAPACVSGGSAGEDSGARRGRQGADGPRAQVQRQGGGEDRGGRRAARGWN